MGFDRAVAPNGYVWWYVDALSDDGAHGITLIAFLGSVFSPYYAWARRGGAVDPLQHCALNVALYGAGQRWAMTERNSARVHRTATMLTIGPSALHWDDDTLVFEIDERTMPFAGHVSGTVRVRPHALTGRTFLLDSAGQHRWSPLSPRAEVEVALHQPALRWIGTGYLDSNDGDVPLEQSFSEWDWCRGAVGTDTAILYEVAQRTGVGASLALRIDQAGGITGVRTAAARGACPDEMAAGARHEG